MKNERELDERREMSVEEVYAEYVKMTKNCHLVMRGRYYFLIQKEPM